MDQETRNYLEHQMEMGGEEILFDSPLDIKFLNPIPSADKGSLKKINEISLFKTYQDATQSNKPKVSTSSDKQDVVQYQIKQKEENLDHINSMEKLMEYNQSLSWYQDKLIVKSTGAMDCKIAVVCMVPTAEDEKSGILLQGEEGALFNQMFKAIGIDRNDIYCTTILKNLSLASSIRWREKYFANRLLHKEISFTKCQHVVLLGEKCIQLFLKTGNSIDEMRKILHNITLEDSNKEISAFVLHHPFELLRFPNKKRLAWEDLQWFQKNQVQNQPQ